MELLNKLKRPDSASAKENSLERTKTLTEIKNWYKDRYETLLVQRNVMFILCLVGLMGLAFSISYVAKLNAQKIFTPYILEVDAKSGIVTQVSSQSVEKYTANDALIRYFINKYVGARENFTAEDYNFFYNQVVRVMSSPNTFNDFLNTIRADNPNSPVNFGNSYNLRMNVKSVTFLQPKLAQVRISIDKVGRGGTAQGKVLSTAHYIITLGFDFLELNLNPNERAVNPLGFQVSSYRKETDAEVVTNDTTQKQ